MKHMSRKAFTIIELLTVVAIIALLIAILTPPLSRAREMARRGLCVAHLRGIGQACITYSAGSRGQFPYAGDPAPGFSAIGDAWDWDGVSTQTYGGNPAPTATPISNTRHLWKLVQLKMADTKTFVCPSDGQAGDPFLPPDLKPVVANRSSISDVQNRSQFSYAFQYQGPALTQSGTRRDGWHTMANEDSRLVILADSSPAFHARNPEAVLTSEDHTFELASSAAGNACYEYVLVLGSVQNITSDPQTGKASWTLPNPDAARELNSPNHWGDGQSVVRLDSSGDFATDPWAGPYMDNIWTVQDPAEYSNPNPNANVMLRSRMQGLYDGLTNTETVLLQNWVVHDWSKNKYPDSFLVP